MIRRGTVDDMKTTDTHRKGQNNGRGRAPLGVTGKLRAFWRDQQDAQELLLEKQAPWMNRH